MSFNSGPYRLQILSGNETREEESVDTEAYHAVWPWGGERRQMLLKIRERLVVGCGIVFCGFFGFFFDNNPFANAEDYDSRGW